MTGRVRPWPGGAPPVPGARVRDAAAELQARGRGVGRHHGGAAAVAAIFLNIWLLCSRHSGTRTFSHTSRAVGRFICT